MTLPNSHAVLGSLCLVCSGSGRTANITAQEGLFA